MRFRQVPVATGQAGKLNAAGGPLKWWRSGRWISPPGEVVEWLMALVLKTSEVQASVGSNPTLSVSQTPRLGGVFLLRCNGLREAPRTKAESRSWSYPLPKGTLR